MLSRLRERNEWRFFGVLPKADRLLAFVWWTVLVLRGTLPAVFAVAMGVLVGVLRQVTGRGGQLVLTSPRPQVFKVLEVAGLTRLFTIVRP